MKNNRVDVVYDYLKTKNQKGPIDFYELYDILSEKDKRFRKEPLLMSQLYTDIIIDGRFIMLREVIKNKEVHLCDIRENYTYEEVKESISKFGDIIINEEDDLEKEEEQVVKAPTGISSKLIKDESTMEIMSELAEREEDLDDSPVKDIDDTED